MEEATEVAIPERRQARLQKGHVSLSTAKNEEATEFGSVQRKGKKKEWGVSGGGNYCVLKIRHLETEEE